MQQLKALGPEMHSLDKKSLERLEDLVRGADKDTRQRDTLLGMIASMTAHDNNGADLVSCKHVLIILLDVLTFPQQSRKVDLRELGVYSLVFEYLREVWEDTIDLISDVHEIHEDSEVLMPVNQLSYSHILVYGLRYGAVTHHRGIKTSYAYVDGRHPVQILHFLRIKHERQAQDLPPLDSTCAIVRPFVNTDPPVPEMPWSLR